MPAPRSVASPSRPPDRAPWPVGDRARLALVARLARPRRVGTAGERRVCRRIEQAFRSAGLEVFRESFAVPWAGRAIGMRLVLGLGAALLAATLGPLAHAPLAAAACGMTVALLANAPWTVARGLGSRMPSRLRSRNLIGRRRARVSGPVLARIVFLAHHDSKSQLLPTGVRVGLVATVAIGGVTLAALHLLRSIGLPIPAAAAPGVAVLLLGCLVLLAWNRTGNRSPGAIDNATGLATLIELARTWRPQTGQAVEAVFVATGAEEIGLDGARAFLERHRSWLQRRPTLIVNLDSVGTGARTYLAGDPHSVERAERLADERGLPTARLRVVGAGMDHEPFAESGLNAVSLLGDVVRCSLILHTPRDTIRRVDPSGMGRALQLAMALADDWAEEQARPQPVVAATIRSPDDRVAVAAR